MIAYLFWHVPVSHIPLGEYEAALRASHADLAGTPPPSLVATAAFRISEVPWLNGRLGYEDWYLLTSSAGLDVLNQAAVKPDRWDVHAALASKMDFGCGGLYHHLRGDERAISGSRTEWLKRPRGIRYEQPLGNLIGGSTGFLSCWRRQMVLGPADEFIVIGTPDLQLRVPDGWHSRRVERDLVAKGAVRP